MCHTNTGFPVILPKKVAKQEILTIHLFREIYRKSISMEMIYAWN